MREYRREAVESSERERTANAEIEQLHWPGNRLARNVFRLFSRKQPDETS